MIDIVFYKPTGVFRIISLKGLISVKLPLWLFAHLDDSFIKILHKFYWKTEITNLPFLLHWFFTVLHVGRNMSQMVSLNSDLFNIHQKLLSSHDGGLCLNEQTQSVCVWHVKVHFCSLLLSERCAVHRAFCITAGEGGLLLWLIDIWSFCLLHGDTITWFS